MLVNIHSVFVKYKSLAYDQIRAYDRTVFLMKINEFLNGNYSLGEGMWV